MDKNDITSVEELLQNEEELERIFEIYERVVKPRQQPISAKSAGDAFRSVLQKIAEARSEKES